MALILTTHIIISYMSARVYGYAVTLLQTYLNKQTLVLKIMESVYRKKRPSDACSRDKGRRLVCKAELLVLKALHCS